MISAFLTAPLAAAGENSLSEKYSSGIYMAPGGSGDGSYGQPTGSFEVVGNIISELKRSGTMPDGGLDVILGGGIYKIPKSINIGADFGGTDSSPVRFKAKDGEKPSFSGGISLGIGDLKKVSDKEVRKTLPDADSVLMADINDSAKIFGDAYKTMDSTSRAVYFGESLMTLSRWPNKDYAQTGEVLEYGSNYFKFVVDDSRVKRWVHEKNAMIFGFFAFTWYADRIRIAEVDTENLAIKSAWSARYGISANKPYYVYNMLSELDYPGEYYLDANKGIFYAVIPNTKNMSSTDINIPLMTDTMIKLNGAKNIEFSGITFENSLGRAAELDSGCKNITFSGCDFKNINYGIYVDGYNNTIADCDFYNMPYRAVTLDGGDRYTLTPGNNKVTNCKFRDLNTVGRTNEHYIRVQGCGNVVSNCEFTGSPHIAMKLHGNDNIVEYNEFYNNMVDKAYDAGVIYAGRDFSSQNNIIRYNYFHDNTDLQGMIYLDDMQSGYKIYGNVFDGCGRAVFVHGGVCNEFKNNLVMNTHSNVLSVIVNGESGAKIKTEPSVSTLLSALMKYDYKNEPWNKYEKAFRFIDNDEYITFNSNGVAILPAYDTVISDNIFYNPESGLKVGVAKETQDYVIISDNKSISKEEHPDFEIPDEFKEIIDKSGLYENENRSYESRLNSFSLIYPENRSENTPADSVTFEWEKVDNARQYLFTLSTDKDFKNIISNKIVENNYITLENLNYSNTRYFWKVCAISNNLKSMGGAENVGCTNEYFTFLTSKKPILNKTKLGEFIETSAAKMNPLTEGEAPGQLKSGTKEKTDSLLGEARAMYANENVTQKEINNFLEAAKNEFENLLYRRNPEYYNISEAVSDATMWSVEPNTFIFDSGRFIQRKNKDNVFGIKDRIDSHKIMRFDVKTESFESAWIGFGLRAQNSPNLIAWGGNPQYLIVIKESTIELQRFGNEHFLKEYPNDFVKAGEWHSYELGAENSDDGSVKLYMNIDGKNVFEYTDDDTVNNIRNSGYFSVYNTGDKNSVEISEYSFSD